MKSELTVQAGHRKLTLKLQPAAERGDETVPSDRSAKHISGVLFEHGKEAGKNYEHQNSFSDSHVLASMLYSIVKIAKSADWSKK